MATSLLAKKNVSPSKMRNTMKSPVRNGLVNASKKTIEPFNGAPEADKPKRLSPKDRIA